MRGAVLTTTIYSTTCMLRVSSSFSKRRGKSAANCARKKFLERQEIGGKVRKASAEILEYLGK